MTHIEDFFGKSLFKIAPIYLNDIFLSAIQNNGFYINSTDFNKYYPLIISKLNGYKPNKLSITVPSNCNQINELELGYNFFNAKNTFQLTQNSNYGKILEVNETNVEFDRVEPGKLIQKEIKLKAINSDIELINLTLTNTYNNAFYLSDSIRLGIDNPIKITQNTEYSFMINFRPIDSNLVFTKVNIQSSA
jgi:hypothetical protein